MAARKRQELKFGNAADLQRKIEAYFARLGPRPPTLSGLAVYLGTTRKTIGDYIRDYQSGEGKRGGEAAKSGELLVDAKARIEAYLEEKLIVDYTRGIEFVLSNGFGWGSKTNVEAKVETEHKGTVAVETEERKLTDEELLAKIEMLTKKAAEIQEREKPC